MAGIGAGQRLLDEAIDLQVGLGDKAAVRFNGGRRLAKPAAQPQRGLVGQTVGEIVIGNKLGLRGKGPFGAGLGDQSSGWLAIRNVT